MMSVLIEIKMLALIIYCCSLIMDEREMFRFRINSQTET